MSVKEAKSEFIRAHRHQPEPYSSGWKHGIQLEDASGVIIRKLEREFSPLASQNAGYSELTAASNSVFGNTEKNYFVEEGSSLEDKKMNYRLSPSDFAFLYEGCKRCYYLKVVHGISQPSIPLPALGETAVCSFFIAKIDRNDIIRLWKQKLKI